MMILTTIGLNAQDAIYIGMSAEEFKVKLPGILPDEMNYSANLSLPETLHGIAGKWAFRINENILVSAGFISERNIRSEDEFNIWTESAKGIIEDYIKMYGQPVKYDKGSCKYPDRNNYEFQKSIGKREMFYESVWKTKLTDIKICCDYRSNYYAGFKEGLPNGPPVRFSYCFKIEYTPVSKTSDAMSEEIGRFYPGMDVKSFATVFPALFPKGIKMSGQWQRNQELYGLKGSWTYRFENGKLSWIHFNKYLDEINENNFKQCLHAATQLINDYTRLYGKPDTTLTGDTTFVDPYKKHHWGYDVIEARWKDCKEMKIKIEFTFMGGKGDYHFLLGINYFDKNYPYYE